MPTVPKGRLIVVGAGKASAEMARATETHWLGPIEGLAATRYGYAVPCKHIEIVEARLGVQLLNRTTRRIGLTPEGEVYLEHARRILADIGDMEQLVSNSVAAPKGLLRVNATLGFGRSHIAPLISDFAKRYPEVQVQLRLRQVLENWQTPGADIHAVYPQRHQTAARVRAFVDFVVNAFSASNPLGQVLPLQQIPP
ncbi:MAG: DUF4147 domain-containing protein [Rhodoferax sp.]|uniref:DUF4147 domain-containing protein n=1 Tax=Rhodoferax sp. TaxID=50421 RepID=UPI0014009499|nr:DUF4147 domain-containing protein [Rhodoferax sp.]NDP38085.1 DUF4147 domain-containing protein [Rhodoferax sp.]